MPRKQRVVLRRPSKRPLFYYWSGRWGSNPRPSAWEADALPLSYARSLSDSVTNYTAAGDIAVNIESYGRHLRAENLSPRAQQTYIESAHQLARFLAQQGMPLDVASITREHVEAIITHLLER